MAFQHHTMSAQIVLQPKTARMRILAAYRKVGASKRDTAVFLGCSEATLWRWVQKLGIAGELKRLEEEALAKGWHYGWRGGRPKGSVR
jgi:hypothetical protein